MEHAIELVALELEQAKTPKEILRSASILTRLIQQRRLLLESHGVSQPSVEEELASLLGERK